MESRLSAPDVRAQLAEAWRLVEQGPAGGTDALADHLYGAWYVQASAPPAPSGPVGAYEHDLPGALRAAHAGTERFTGGWRAAQVSTRGRVRAVPVPSPAAVPAGETAVHASSARLLGRADYLVPGRAGLRAEPGDGLRVVERVDYVDPGGFWVTHLPGWPPPAGTVLTRVYWRVAPAGAPALVRNLTAQLLDAGVPAALKVLGNAGAFGRADAAVLYLPRTSYPAVAGGLAGTADALAPHLADPPPRLTLRLRPGVGLGESPLDGPSFGQVRCRLVAEALQVAAPADTGAAVAAVVDRFAVAGLDPDRPWLAAPAPAADPYGP